MINLSDYLFRKVLRISAFNITTGELYVALTNLNNVTISNTQESTDITAAGVKLAQLDYGKASTITGESALVSDGIIGLQSGSDVETKENVTNILYPETVSVTNGIATLSYAATGTSGAEIGYAYLIDNKGSKTKTFIQDSVTSAVTFSYSSATKELIFDVDEVPDGSQIMVYYYPTVTTAKVITNDTNKFSKSAKILAEIQVADVCDTSNESLMHFVYENGKFSGSYDWSIDGQTQTVQSFEIASMQPCGSSKLWEAHVFREDDIVVA